jgi:hypothetical protein
MANIKISDMTSVAAASGTQEFEVNDSGSTKKVSGAQLAAYINGELTLADLGITSSAAEINYTDITTLGTSEASKVVTADANGDVNLTEELKAKSYNETYVAVTSSGAATTVNCEAGNSFMHTLKENTTFTFSNPPASGTAYTMSIEIIQDASASGYTVTWPTSVDWPAGAAPTLTATASAKDVLVFTTRDGGVTWLGFTAGLALA